MKKGKPGQGKVQEDGTRTPLSGVPECGTLSLRDGRVVLTANGTQTTVTSIKISSIREIEVEREGGNNLCRVMVSNLVLLPSRCRDGSMNVFTRCRLMMGQSIVVAWKASSSVFLTLTFYPKREVFGYIDQTKAPSLYVRSWSYASYRPCCDRPARCRPKASALKSPPPTLTASRLFRTSYCDPSWRMASRVPPLASPAGMPRANSQAQN